VDEKEKGPESAAKTEKAPEAKKSLGQRLQKAALSRVMKYLQSPQGMSTLNKVLDAKKNADNAVSSWYEAAGLGSLRSKRQVEWAVDRQTKRLRDLSGEFDQIEEILAKLEKSVAAANAAPPEPPMAEIPVVAPPEPPPVETPIAPPPVVTRSGGDAEEAPPPAAPPKRKSAPKTKTAPPERKTAPVKAAKPAKKIMKISAKKPAKKTAAPKPKPLRAAKPSLTSARRSLLDLNWKGKPKK